MPDNVSTDMTPPDNAAPYLSDVGFLAHFDIEAGQVAESITVAPDGSAVVGTILARQVLYVSAAGEVQVLVTMPEPADGGVNTPGPGFPCVAGNELTEDGTVYFLYNAGDDTLTGLWRLRIGGSPERFAALPVDGFLNGLARDKRTGHFYIPDSKQGRVWRVSPDGTFRVWASGPELAPIEFFGANGLQLHNGAVWVSNTDRASIVRIPITPSGDAGQIETVFSEINDIDDFAFTGDGDELLAALNRPCQVALVQPGKEHRIVLEASDGLQNPTAVAVEGDTVYVTNGALWTREDPNVLTARIRR